MQTSTKKEKITELSFVVLTLQAHVVIVVLTLQAHVVIVVLTLQAHVVIVVVVLGFGLYQRTPNAPYARYNFSFCSPRIS
jgi:uncharacterized membrane protein